MLRHEGIYLFMLDNILINSGLRLYQAQGANISSTFRILEYASGIHILHASLRSQCTSILYVGSIGTFE